MATLSEINALPPAEFVRVLRGVFEHSPWVADAVASMRPFPSIEALHTAMNREVALSSIEKQLALIQAHPDLAGRLATLGQLTAESSREQASAGLTDADSETLKRIGELNTAYQTKFGFPFIICARLNNVDTILEAMRTRVHHEAEEEMTTALSEIGKITHLRLKDLVED